MSRLQDVILRDVEASRPAATAVATGTLFFATDTQVTTRSNGTAWESYSSAAASGDVVGPSSAVDQAIALFDGTTGKLLKDSTVLVTTLAPKASPALTGTPTAPTAAPGTATTQLATTAFVAAATTTPTAHHTTHEPGGSDALQLSAASKLFGRGDSGAGALQEITLGSNLSMTGTTLDALVHASSIFEYSFSSATSAPPGSTQIRFDAGSPYSAVTKVWIRNVTSNGVDVYQALRLLPTGAHILIQDKNDHTQYVVFAVSGTPIDNTTYFEIPVTFVEQGTALSGGQPVLFQSVGTSGSGSGTVTHTVGALTDHAVVVGNAADDIQVLSSLGTSGQVLTSQGAGADPIWAASSFDTTADYTVTGLWTHKRDASGGAAYVQYYKNQSDTIIAYTRLANYGGQFSYVTVTGAFELTNDGALQNYDTSATGLSLGAASMLTWSSSGAYYNTRDLRLWRTGTKTLEVDDAAAGPAIVSIKGQIYSGTKDDGNSSTAITFNFNDGNNHESTLTGAAAITLSNPKDGATYGILLKGGAGGFTPTWPGSVVWGNGTAPTYPIASGHSHLVRMQYFASIGKYLAGWADFVA